MSAKLTPLGIGKAPSGKGLPRPTMSVRSPYRYSVRNICCGAIFVGDMSNQSLYSGAYKVTVKGHKDRLGPLSGNGAGHVATFHGYRPSTAWPVQLDFNR